MIRQAILKAVAVPGYQVPFASRGNAAAVWVGDRRHTDHGQCHRSGRYAEGHRSGGGRHDQRGQHSRLFPENHGCVRNRKDNRCHRHPDAAQDTRNAADRKARFWSTRCRSRPLRWLEPREAETRKMHALEEYGVMRCKSSTKISRSTGRYRRRMTTQSLSMDVT